MIAPALPRLLAVLLLSLGLALGGTGHAAGGAKPQPHAAGAIQVLVFLRLPPPHVRAGGDYASGYGDRQGRAARRRIAQDLARSRGMMVVDAWGLPLIGYDCFVMAGPSGRTAAEMAAQLSADRRVAWAEPMGVYHGQGVRHDDPLFEAQPAARTWRLADLHEVATGRGVRVAVIDSRVDIAHPDLLGQVADFEDLTTGHGQRPEAHGTAVAGVIAAKADNGLGVVGVAPGARLLALRACWETPAAPEHTVCDSLSLAKALVAAIDQRARVINLSLSGPPALVLSKLIDVALDRGAAVVSAFDADLPGGGFPASHPGVIAVAAAPAGPGVFVAPGRDIPTTEPRGLWGLADGSSYSAAHVSGLLALVFERNANAKASAVLVTSGANAVDACRTLRRATSDDHCPCEGVSRAPSLARC